MPAGETGKERPGVEGKNLNRGRFARPRPAGGGDCPWHVPHAVEVMRVLDCPCGQAPGRAGDARKCPVCGLDLGPLHRLRALPLEKYRQAVELRARGEEFAALVRLKLLLAAAPEHVEARLLLADILQDMGRREEVQEQVRLLRALDPEDPRVQTWENRVGRGRAHAAEIPARGAGPALPGRAAVVLLLSLILAAGIGAVSWSEEQPPEPETLEQALQAVQDEVLDQEPLADLGLVVLPLEDWMLLMGEVPSEAARREIVERVRAQAGPFSVEDALVVGPSGGRETSPPARPEEMP